ncbi:MAG: hypothetical protein CL402_06650 [Acidiferrobacteraceae bacterium]|nr:hypothetical protein [Acidiferrobacteraceae bacterium]
MNQRVSDAPKKRCVNIICESNTVEVGGIGVKFEIKDGEGKIWPAFLVRHKNGISGYLNRCSHLALELDWSSGNFFDEDAEFLICATHGALYEPDTGSCVGGPCNGKALETLQIKETKGNITLNDPKYTFHQAKK